MRDDSRTRCFFPRCFSDGRRASKNGGTVSGGFARRDGGSIPKRAGGRYCLDRPAECSRAAARQSDRVARSVEFTRVRHFPQRCARVGAFPEDTWPDNIELLYYSFHIMAGLGTVFILLMACANIQLGRRRLEKSSSLLW